RCKRKMLLGLKAEVSCVFVMKNIKNMKGIAVSTTAIMLALCIVFSTAASAYTTNPEAHFTRCSGTEYSNSWKNCGSEWYKLGSNSNMVFYRTGVWTNFNPQNWPWSYYKVYDCWIIDYQNKYSVFGTYTTKYAYNRHTCAGTRNCASFCTLIDGEWKIRGNTNADCCT
ncbi:MAG: hypothetical protein JW724_05925, partial [Candidatus Altiarchaeota archaeon]|nr:hypothetical protein [Candidatus Altiarchaeota archaeon]